MSYTTNTIFWSKDPSSLANQAPALPKIIHDPHRPPIYFIDPDGVSNNIISGIPNEVLLYQIDMLPLYLLAAKVKLGTPESISTMMKKWDYKDFMENNPWVDWLARTPGNYSLGYRVMNLLHNMAPTLGVHSLFGDVYWSVQPMKSREPLGVLSITEIPRERSNIKANTVIGYYIKLLRDYPFKDPERVSWDRGMMRQVGHNMPGFWLNDSFDDSVEDKVLYARLSGRG